MNILFHPYFIRSFKSNLIGLLFELSENKNNKIVLLCDKEILEFYNSKSYLFKNNNIIIEFDNKLFPVFSLKELFFQSIVISKSVKKLINKYNFDSLIIENDCMSFSSMIFSDIFNTRNIEINCYQSLGELSSNDYKNNQYRYYKMHYRFFNKFLMNVFRKLHYLIIHYFFYFITLKKFKFSTNSYTSKNCFSGCISSCNNYVFEEFAIKKFNSLPVKKSSKIKLVPHFISKINIPIDLFFKSPNNLFSKQLLILVPPDLYNIKIDILNKSMSSIISYCDEFCIKSIDFKLHPDANFQFVLDTLGPYFTNFKTKYFDKDFDVNIILLDYTNLIALPPGDSSLLSIFKFISNRFNKVNLKTISIDKNGVFNQL